MKTKDQEDEEKVPIINSDINETCLDHEEVLEERCYGWWVVLSCFLCNMIIDGIGYSYGVLLEPLKSEFQSGTGSVALVGSILAGVIMLTGPVAAASVNRFGTRITCICGSFISSAALFSSSFSSSISILMLTYGILGGIGLGLIYVPAVIAVGQYFNKRLNLATGVSVCGSGVGTFIFAPVAAYLVDSFGWRGCNRVMAGLCLLSSLFGLIMVPVNKNTKRKDDHPLINFSILRSIPFVLYSIANIPTLMAVYTTYAYLPSLGTHLGLSAAKASLLISVVGITNTVGRIVSGGITDLPRVSPLVVCILATGIGGIFPVVLPLGGSYTIMMMLAGFFGFIISALPTTSTGIIVDLLGIKNLNSAFGILTFVRGAAALVGPPFAGFILDHFRDYSVAFTCSTILFALAFLGNSLAWFITRYCNLNSNNCDQRN